MSQDDDPFHAATIPTRVLLGSFSADVADPLHDLIRSARAGDEGAVAEVLARVRAAAPQASRGITDGVVVAVPGHAPGHGSGLVPTLADAIAAANRWDHEPNALRRAQPSPEGKLGGARDALEEAGTLEWNPTGSGASVVLVDDVIRSGTTLAACAMAIRMAGDRRPVFALVVASRQTVDHVTS